MSVLNADGVTFIHQRVRALAVSSMDVAAEAIAGAIETSLAKATPVNWADPVERLAYAKHLAWLIGFDALTNDRAEIHGLTRFVVQA